LEVELTQKTPRHEKFIRKLFEPFVPGGLDKLIQESKIMENQAIAGAAHANDQVVKGI
jgi:hypothetical protein